MNVAVTKRLLVLGSTGSIGRQTLDVIAGLNVLAGRGECPVRFEVVGLAAGRDADALLAQASGLNVRELALCQDSAGAEDMARARGANLRVGPDSALRLVQEIEADVVVAAIVGVAGLPATLAAAALGRDIALANKETLVAAGELVTRTCHRTGARLLPLDSEHSAIWQCLIGHQAGAASRAGHGELDAPPCMLDSQVKRVILTASGGALRSKSRQETYDATPEDALRHPTWSMGAKVTIDSASLTNKALEVIEAHWLFGLESARIGVLVHPQSVVHSMVEFAEGSTIAQLGTPDMRTPIQFALTFPAHLPGRAPSMNWPSLSRLDFSEPDLERFPALALGFRVIDEGGSSGAVFNAGNEAAVEAFLARRIPFGRIAELSKGAMDALGVSPVRDLADVLEAEREARRYVSMELSGSSASATT